MTVRTASGMPAGRVLILFVVAHTLLAVDRSIMAVMLEPIREEFALTDTQLGFLTGIGFALFFGLAGLPLGWMVDRFNRRNILAASVGVFSIMTAAAAATGSFVQLLITRLLVGAGEAGGGPAMLSMISDLYPPDKRASAVAAYYAGAPIGAILILFAGGWIAAEHGWRAAFLVAGLPGIVLAIALMTIREPQRQGGGGDDATAAAAPFREVLAYIWAQRSLRHLLVTATITSAATAGLFSFTISYLVRVQGASLPTAGMMMAAGYGVTGLLSTSVSGRIVDRLAARDERWRPWFCAICCGLSVPAVAIMVVAPSLLSSGIGLALWAAFSVATYGPLMALLQSLVKPRMRGTVSAIFYILSYFVGVSVGPQFVGLFSDYFSVTLAREGLGFALLAVSGFYLWGAVHFFLAGKTVRRDLTVAA